MKHLLTVSVSAVLAGACILIPAPAGQHALEVDRASYETPTREPAPVPVSSPPTRVVTVEAVERAAATVPDPDDVPEDALLAYQRAAQILSEVSPDCALPWTLLAAIGGVESDHGRHPGSSATTGEVPQSAVRVSTARGESPIASDGPMQISPSLWEVVGVDADGDGERSVRDIDDAALAAGVYLCAGWSGLDDPDTMAEAVYNYRESEGFVDLVVRFEQAYRAVELLTPDQVMPPTPPVLSDLSVPQADLDVGRGEPADPKAKARALADSKKAVTDARKKGDKLDSATRERKGDPAPTKAKSDKKSDKPSPKPSKQPGKPAGSGKPTAPADKPGGGSGTPATGTPGTPGGKTPGAGTPDPSGGNGTPPSGNPGGGTTDPAPSCPHPEPTDGTPTQPGQTPGATGSSAVGNSATGSPATPTPSGTEAGRDPSESASDGTTDGSTAPGCTTSTP